jgi:hypothetical protein
MKKMLVQTILLLAMLVTSFHARADEIIPIQEINNAPANFDEKEVKLKGTPKNPTRLPLINLKSYVLEDASGEIMILTAADLPKMKEEMTIRVRIKSLAIIQGEALGLTAIELERYGQQQEI